jgi:hypothetical protein
MDWEPCLIPSPAAYCTITNVGSGLTVSQNNVIATGNVVYKYPNSTVNAHATVWTNGEPETLAQGADDTNVYFANSIVVKH